VIDHIPRQHEIEAVVVERQRISRSLTQTQGYTAGLRRFARHSETGGTAVNRVDRQPVLREKQRMPADTAAEIERRAGAARFELRQ
jgi:hypothetical protein